MKKADVERYLKAYYGQQHVVWLGEGIAGDDTDGHVDDLARFVGARTIVTALEDDPADANYGVLHENLRRLERARDADGRPFTIVEIPMPAPVFYQGERLPATYVNFYFVNGALLVPTYRDRRNDQRALAILQRALPDREVIGIDCTEIIWGLGAIHCLTQQVPAW
jgi:agmatine deiminase